MFRLRIESGRRLIHYYYIKRRCKDSGNGDLLRFSAGQIDTVFVKLFCHFGTDPVGQCLQLAFKASVFQCIPYSAFVGFFEFVTQNIFGKRQRKNPVVLQNNAYSRMYGGTVKLFNAFSVVQDLTLLGIVKV